MFNLNPNTKPMSKLHWRRMGDCFYTLERGDEIPGTAPSVNVLFACEGAHLDWTTYLHSPNRHHAFPVRCDSLQQAADCARRWAEYCGFTVSGRFPEKS